MIVFSAMQFYRHFSRAVLFASTLIGIALVIGTCGYHWFAGFAWIDALHSATMILTGMGPVGDLETNAAKLFATAYALFSALVFVTASGIILSPMVHRVLHKFHVDDSDSL